MSTTTLWAYLCALIAMAALDAIWLGWLARDLYQREMASLMASPINRLPALLFYLGYPAGLVLLALTPRPELWSQAVLRSALCGLVAYGTYDLTCLAIIRGFSQRLAWIDMAWGMVASAIAGSVAWLVLTRWR
jgi:uncharacterized membrane protein